MSQDSNSWENIKNNTIWLSDEIPDNIISYKNNNNTNIFELPDIILERDHRPLPPPVGGPQETDPPPQEGQQAGRQGGHTSHQSNRGHEELQPDPVSRDAQTSRFVHAHRLQQQQQQQ